MTSERDQLSDRLSHVSDEEARRWGIAGFVGQSTTIKKILSSIGRLQGTTTAVLITGESGTGKELVARAVGRLDV
ncbi:MAG: hypothetical protein CME24_19990 [Gemmatimonadetes bacterium]|nr:hypothetical protein [Gemmatimonadota bacterium]